MDKSRRDILALAALTPFVLAAKPKATKPVAASSACYDPGKLSLADRSSRRTVNFIETSKDPTKRCGLCVFYDAGAGNCGKCKLFAGMPTNSDAFCESFAAKPK